MAVLVTPKRKPSRGKDPWAPMNLLLLAGLGGHPMSASTANRIAQSPQWPSDLTAIATGVTAIILLGAALYARQQAQQARLLREAQVRPFVALDFDVTSRPPIIFLDITNFGSMLARNVHFHFDPPLASSFDAQASSAAPAVGELNIFTKGIPSLVPGKRISILFDSAIDRTGHPDHYQVEVSYDGEGDRHYAETLALDLEMYEGYTYVQRKDIHDVHERLKEIGDTLKKSGR